MKKIAVIVTEPFTILRGQANAELNRIRHLQEIADYKIDVYSFAIYERWLVRKLRNNTQISTPPEKNVKGVNVHFKWRAFSIIDYILTIKLHRQPIINKGWALKFIDRFKDYDMIMAHSETGGEIALAAHRLYGIPYSVTWHGSDIHTAPFTSTKMLQMIKDILDNAIVNIMVSSKLSDIAYQISDKGNKVVVYNGVSSSFYRFDNSRRSQLRQKYDVEGKAVVAFAGNLVPVKDPMSLPEIFRNVYLEFNNSEFWVVGSGKLLNNVKRKCDEYHLPVKFLGDVQSEEMVNRYNSIDVLVLPSINEGLPLVAVEALACGANVVGANVGGIPEVIRQENAFDRDDCFIEKISNRIIAMISGDISQELDPCFSWKETARIEDCIVRSILTKGEAYFTSKCPYKPSLNQAK